MLVSLKDEPLVNLVAEAQRVVFDAEVCDHLQLASGKNLQEKKYGWRNKYHQSSEWLPVHVLTFPIGLLGVLMMIAFVLELNFAESSSGSRNQSPLETVFFPDFCNMAEKNLHYESKQQPQGVIWISYAFIKEYMQTFLPKKACLLKNCGNFGAREEN